jgi:hypothetical protein
MYTDRIIKTNYGYKKEESYRDGYFDYDLYQEWKGNMSKSMSITCSKLDYQGDNQREILCEVWLRCNDYYDYKREGLSSEEFIAFLELFYEDGLRKRE